MNPSLVTKNGEASYHLTDLHQAKEPLGEMLVFPPPTSDALRAHL